MTEHTTGRPWMRECPDCGGYISDYVHETHRCSLTADTVRRIVREELRACLVTREREEQR